MQELRKLNLKEISEELIATHGSPRAALLPILNRLRTDNITIDATVMTMIADTLQMAPSAIYGVVSFYSFLDYRPKGTHVIRVCQTISCKMAGSADVAQSLQDALGIAFGETTADGQFSLEHTNCLGLCNEAPAMLLNETAHTRIDGATVTHILQSIREMMPLVRN